MTANNPLIEQYQLIKELYFVFDNIDPQIRGKILKIIKGANAKYTWTVNYYCRKADEISAYVPSAPFRDTEDEIEANLLNYVKRFETAADWQLNEYY